MSIGIEGYFYKIQTNYQVYAYLIEKELTKHPDSSKLSPALFWDTRVEKINWIRNKKWAVQRFFEYGNKQEIDEIIRFYGKETIRTILQGINSNWERETRERSYKDFAL